MCLKTIDSAVNGESVLELTPHHRNFRIRKGSCNGVGIKHHRLIILAAIMLPSMIAIFSKGDTQATKAGR